MRTKEGGSKWRLGDYYKQRDAEETHSMNYICEICREVVGEPSAIEIDIERLAELQMQEHPESVQYVIRSLAGNSKKHHICKGCYGERTYTMPNSD